ncbi:MAG TPA: metallophosphoesterase [Solirubrobacter sp.]|nr:metallophosphoesterase [Solirubrobacter sp.]
MRAGEARGREPRGGGTRAGRRGGETRAGRRAAAAAVAIAAAALAFSALALSACGAGDALPAAPRGGSTLKATLVDQNGDGFLERGPGEPLIDRGPRATPGRTLATFAQLTDLHVRDEESPARVPFLDRLGPPFTSTFRPQEAFSTQTLDAAVRALNREHPQAVFLTGDITDNAQRNELTMALDTLNGRTVHPDSGAPGYDGVQSPDSADPFYYRPDHDAPVHPGVLDAAQRPFKAAGLDAPWYALVGNHDVLAQGEVPPTPAIDALATGDRAATALDPRARPPRDEQSAQQAVAAALAGALPLDYTHTPPDPQRRLNQPGEAERRIHQRTTIDLNQSVRAILIDTVNRDGTSQARVNPQQLQTLQRQLQTRRWVLVFSHNPLPEPALSILDHAPNVVATIAGDSHKNRIERRGRYWRITTSSLADFPQQARMFRLRATTRGVALETWMVDHDGGRLARISRELAYLDAQGGRPQHFAGTRADRNARLLVPATSSPAPR